MWGVDLGPGGIGDRVEVVLRGIFSRLLNGYFSLVQQSYLFSMSGEPEMRLLRSMILRSKLEDPTIKHTRVYKLPGT